MLVLKKKKMLFPRGSKIKFFLSKNTNKRSIEDFLILDPTFTIYLLFFLFYLFILEFEFFFCVLVVVVTSASVLLSWCRDLGSMPEDGKNVDDFYPFNSVC